MSIKPILVGAGLFVALGLLAGWAFSGDRPQKPTPEQMQAMMEKCLKLNQPGAGHRRLDRMVGEWDTVSKFWMGGPGSEPTVNEGQATCRWILDGRYIEEVYQGSITMPDPAKPGKTVTVPFAGRGTTGYDNYRKLYVSTWCDSMSTQMFISRGSWHPVEEKFHFYGEMDEPALDVTGRMVKCVVTVVDEDRHLFEMYDLHAGEDYKIMEIAYSRRK